MLFNSFQFLVFFIIVTGLYFALPYNKRWILLLVGSCYFYMAFIPIYILILGFTIMVDYYAGIFIEKSKGKQRKIYLIASLCANIGVLAVFKYYNFLNENLSGLLQGFGYSNPVPYLTVLLPIGLSFHTFQAMSYTIEVYRGNQKAERHFGIYSLYVMFYPQLVAGPIERPSNLIPQLKAHFDFNYDRVTNGLKLMLWGLFKKVVIADRLAIVVDNVYANPTQYNSLSLLIATLFFSFQIYCDFSGYSDMAIGASRIMGIRLMKNFDRPYQSLNIRDFWKRWHMSLSTWFKDYFYISIGGNRVSVPRWYLNLLIVFLVSGLWHGANWTFIIWGGIHGIYVIIYIFTTPIRRKLFSILPFSNNSFLSAVITFLFVSFAWIFFRASDIQTAFYIITRIFSGFPEIIERLWHHQWVIEFIGETKIELVVSILLIVILEVVQYINSKGSILNAISRYPIYLRWGLYMGLLFIILIFGFFENRQFIYFQF